MSKFTKMAITNCFIELSQEMPIEKITVTEITKRCGINRNTFYYHYQDVYALLEEIIYTKCEKLFACDYDDLENSWTSNLRFIGQYAKQNEEFIKSIYQSMGRDAFEDYMADVSYKSIYETIEYAICKAAGEDGKRPEKAANIDNIDKIDSNLLRKKVSGKAVSCAAPEEVIKEAALLFARFFAQIAVDWIRGKSGKDPVAIMEEVIQRYRGVPETIIKNIMEEHED